MIYNKSELLEAIKKIDGIINITTFPGGSGNEIAFEWKNRTLILSFQNEDTLDETDKMFLSEFQLYFIYRPDSVMDKIPLMEKYKISNYVTAKSVNTSSVVYIESKDVFKVTAKYNSMIENIADYKEVTNNVKTKGLQYIITYLLGMCLNTAANTGQVLLDYIKKPEEYQEKLRAY